MANITREIRVASGQSRYSPLLENTYKSMFVGVLLQYLNIPNEYCYFPNNHQNIPNGRKKTRTHEKNPEHPSQFPNSLLLLCWKNRIGPRIDKINDKHDTPNK